MKRRLSSGIAVFFLCSSAFAGGGKEFTTSVIYGTLAGTLVGAATLAFTSNPGDNLNNVARGASYGLYAGILLGLYVTYGVSDNNTPPATETIQPDQNIYEGTPPPAPPPDDKPQGKNETNGPMFALYPVAPTSPSHPHDWGVGATLLNLRF